MPINIEAPRIHASDRHILVVEDDPVFAKLESRILSAEGYACSWAPTGEAALEMVRAAPFEYDMALLDLELGVGMNGSTTAERLLEIRSLPIVFVSGHTDSDLFADTARIPSFGFIVKHAGNAVLRNSVAMAFRLWESLQRQNEQDRQFRLIMENLPEVLIRVNTELKVVFASPALSRYSQKSSAEMTGKSLDELGFSPELGSQIQDVCQKCYRDRSVLECEFTEVRPDRKTAWEVRASPEWDHSAQVSTILIFMRDITERRESEEFRRLTEARLSCMLDLHNRSMELDDKAILEEALSIVAQLMECRGAAAWYTADESNKEVRAEWDRETQSLVAGRIPRGTPGFFDRYGESMDGLGGIKTALGNPEFLEKGEFGPHSMIFPILDENHTVMLITLWGRTEGFSPRHLEHVGLWGNETARILQKKRIRDALVLQSDHNRAILAASPDGFMLLDDEKRIQDVNDAWLKLFGFRRSEVLGQDTRMLESGSSSNDLASRMKTVRYKGTDRFEATLKNRDGSLVDLELSVSYSAVGHHYLCLMRDIRSRKEHERKLLKMQGLLEETGRMSKTGAWDFALDTRKFYWTDELFRIFDLNTDFEIGLDHIMPFLDGDDYKTIEQTVRDALAKDTGFEAEFSIHTFTGKRKRVKVQGSPGYRGSQMIRLYGTLQDMSRQYEVENDLRMRDSELRRFFEMSEDLLGIADSQTNRFISLSPGWARSLGYETRELEGTRLTDLIHPDDVETSFRMISQAREGSPTSFTGRYRCKDSSYRSIEWRLTPGGKRIYIVARDITLQMAQQQERLHNEKRNHRLLELYQTNFDSEEAIISTALEQAMELTGSQVAYCHFVHDDQINLDLFAWSRSCLDKCFIPEQRHYPLDKAGIWADPVRTHQGVIHNNYLEHAGRKGLPEGHVGFDHHLSVPVMEGDKVRLVAGVGKEGSPYAAEMMMNLELFMSGIWKIVQKFRSDQIAHHREDEKKDLWKELNHRLKNTAQTIQSMLELEEQHSRSDEARMVLRKTSNRIGSLMRTFQSLYRSNTGLTINLRAYLEETIYQLVQENMGSKNSQNPAPELNFHCPDLLASLKSAAALGLICGELVSNGLRHAFDGESASPSMEISIKPLAGKELQLEYQDNGKGFAKGKSPDRHRKFGLELIYMQVETLGGIIEWNNDPGCNCRIQVHI